MRVLMVEDETEVAGVITRKLNEIGFAADQVGSLRDAREALNAHQYALAILDRRLPDGDGVSLVPELRRKHRNIRILMLTACDGTHDIVSGLDSGADDYVTKPFHFDELMARIRTVLRRSDGEPLPPIRVGALSFDPHLRDVSINGKSAILHGRELMLLEVLVRNVGRMVSRQTLMAEIYGFTDCVEPKAVNLLVLRLRRRLSELNANVEIHAARGVGYMMTKTEP
jgi:two-component system, OmpR family, response regulator